MHFAGLLSGQLVLGQTLWALAQLLDAISSSSIPAEFLQTQTSLAEPLQEPSELP